MERFRSPLRGLLFGIAAIVVLGARPSWAQTKLYLKDGTYLLVRSYQVQGDRVHYYSIAEGQWEDVPVSLVDFKATERAITARQEQEQKTLQEAGEAARNTYQLPQNTGFQIAPGVRLPYQEGLYAYDGSRLITLLQSQSTVVRDKKRVALKMAIPGPFLKGQSLAILPGDAAAVRIFSPDPTFYAKFADGTGSRLVLLKLKPGRDDRQIEKLDAARGGQTSELRTALPVRVTKLTPILFKLIPAQPLNPGEYALAELGENSLNLNVWDFGIDSPNEQPKHGLTEKVIRGLAKTR
jgi:hypothetical protein